MIQYFLEAITFQMVFLIIYDFWLKRETFFQWNRAYLIGTYVLSLVLPWVKIEAFKTTVPEAYYAYPEFLWTANDMVAVTVTGTEADGGINISWEYLMLFSGMVLASLFFGNKLRQLYVLRKKGKVQRFTDFTQIIIANSQIAFSFLKSIFVGDKILQGNYNSVIAHELVHIRQRHTYDLLFFELMRILCWFNPLVYVYQGRLAELHEFIADAHVAKDKKKEHYQLLLSQVFDTQHISFINQFFKSSLLKKRIVMLQKKQSKKIWQLKYLLLVPMILGIMAYTSSERRSVGSSETETAQNKGDKELIAEVQDEIEMQVQKLIANKETAFADSPFGPMDDRSKAIYVLRRQGRSTKKVEATYSKKEFFRDEILMKLYFENISQRIKSKSGEAKNFAKTLPLPSTERYQNYVNREKAFQILDNNLKFSINQSEFTIRKVKKEDQNFGPGEFLTVNDLGDLTGEEIRNVNRMLAQIDDQRFLVLSDGKNAYLIEKKDLQITQHLKSDAGSTVQKPKGPSYSSVKTIPLNEIVIGAKGISHGTTFPTMSVDEAPIFPVCESAKDSKTCFQENLIDHFKKYLKYPKKAQEKSIQGRVYLLFTIDEAGNIANIRKRSSEKSLADEVVRVISLLPKMTPGKVKGHVVNVPFSIPITFKLDTLKIVALKSIDSNTTAEDVYNIKKYNNLVKERKRLLQNMSEDNPMIQNLDPQLNALREQLSQSTRNTKKSIYPRETIETLYNTKKYNELVKERKRLLQNTSEENTMIENLDPQLSALREHILKNEKNASNPDSLQNRKMQKSESVPFAFVEEVPVFPGCEDADDKRACFQESMQKHIQKNFKYPSEAREKGIQGRVSTMFHIAKDGSISNARFRAPDPLLEVEAKRIINKLPQMIPGKKQGEAVTVSFSIPITFKLRNMIQEPGGASKDSDLKSTSGDIQILGYSYDKNKGLLTGQVLDGAGLPLPGTNITNKDFTTGIISDFDGNFSLKAKKGDVIIFQYIGLPVLQLTVTDEKE